MMNIQQLTELGFIIDRACDIEDEAELKLIIETNQNYINSISDSKIKSILYYFLANAWAGLKNIRHNIDSTSIWNYEQEETNQQIIYLRKAKQEKGFLSLEKEYQLSILTNLANIFNHIGRPVCAISLYNQALLIDPVFFMAKVNRGVCLLTYLNLDYDKGHKNIFAILAYNDFKESFTLVEESLKLNHHDREYYLSIKELCAFKIEELEQFFSKDFLREKLLLNKFSLGESEKEQDYRKWVLNKTLFLNSINDISSFNIAGHDPLNLPDMITEIEIGFPKYITYFNQIKQEFIFNRFLLYEGINELTENFYDKETSITDDYDYNLYNISIEKVKHSFRGFYSIFDKIAYFLNDYFILDYNERSIDFRKIWIKNKCFNSKFDNFDNLTLRGLYLISKDLYFYKYTEDNTFLEVLEPKAKRINEIRNYLEHKFIKIKLLDVENDIDNREEIFYITEDELYEKTIYLAQLAREAIIYLSLAVHNEERKKDIDNLCLIDLKTK